MSTQSSIHLSIFELLPLYVNDSLGSEETSSVEAHIKDCAICQQEVEFERQVQAALASNVDVSQLAHQGLTKFNAMVDSLRDSEAGEMATSTNQAATGAIDATAGVAKGSKAVWLQRVSGLGSILTRPWPLGAAMAVGICAVIGIQLWQPTSPTLDSIPEGSQALTGPSNTSLTATRGCEPTNETQRYKITVEFNGNKSASIDTIRVIMKGVFPDKPFTIDHYSQSDLTLVINVDDCDSRMFTLIESIDEIESVKAVAINNITSSE